MKISFKNSILEKSSIHRNLEDILDDIKNGTYKTLIEEIRNENSKDKRNILKQKLPTFITGVLLEEGVNCLSKSLTPKATGLFQFDIDDYDEKKSKQIIGKLKDIPWIIYAFISPSKGLKFGVLSDLDCEDKETLNKKYIFGYEILRNELTKTLGELEGIDNSCSSISQQCYFSYDPELYFNNKCDRFILNNEVNRGFEIYLKDRKITSNSYNNTDDEIIECLKYIPDYLEYRERLQINFAVIDHFGFQAKPILMDHWKGVKDKLKLEKQIDYQITKYDGRISLSSLFYWAINYGYDYSKSTKIVNKNIVPTYNSEKYYSPEEATLRLKEIILEEFFKGKRDKVVLVECGAGKTRTMYKTVSKFLLENKKARVAIFLKTHEMINQFVDDMNASIEEYNNRILKEQGGFKVITSGVQVCQKPKKIKGIEQLCIMYEKKQIGRMGSSICTGCFYKEVESCPYYEQFEDLKNVRVYTHNRLFTKPNVDRNFKPDFIVIDEDIVSMMVDTKQTLLCLDHSNYKSLSHLLFKLNNNEDLVQASSELYDLLKSDFNSIEFDIARHNKTIQGYRKANVKLTNNSTNYQDTYNKIELLKKHRNLIFELLELSCGNKVVSKKVWVQFNEGKDKPLKLIYGEALKILPEYRKSPMLYLDASGEKKVIQSLMSRNFDFESLNVYQQKNAKIYQFQNRASFSKSSFFNDFEGKKIKEIINWVNTLETKKIGLIRYNKIGNNIKYFDCLDTKINEINGRTDKIGWFGNVRGINRFEDCDTLIVLGQHRLPDYEIFNISQLIFRKDIIDEPLNKIDEFNANEMKKVKVQKAYRMKDGNHQKTFQDDYENYYCTLTSNHFDKSENYQAVHRIRLIHGNDVKSVYIISDLVIDISVDELLDRYKEFNPKGVEVVLFIKKNKYLLDSNSSFLEKFDWDETQCKVFRGNNKKGYGTWLKHHRSLRHWVIKTKERKSIKLYTWHDQNIDNVKKWLIENQGMEVQNIKMT